MITLVDISKEELHFLCGDDSEHDLIDGLSNEDIKEIKDKIIWSASGIDDLKFVGYMMLEYMKGDESYRKYSSFWNSKDSSPRFPLVQFEEDDIKQLAKDFGWPCNTKEELNEFILVQNVVIKDGDDTQEDLYDYFFGGSN